MVRCCPRPAEACGLDLSLSRPNRHAGGWAQRSAERGCLIAAILALALGGGCVPLGPQGDPADPEADAARTVTRTDTPDGRPVRVTLDATASRDGTAPIVAYEWILDGDVVAEGERADIALEPGDYEITLRVTDEDGRVDEDRVTVKVAGPRRSAFNLVISTSGGGGAVEPPVGTTSFPAGTTVVVRATPEHGFQFVRWSGDVSTTDAATAVIMDRDRFVTAEFESIDAADHPLFFAPWAPGEIRSISQGNHGPFSHQNLFAWDVPMPIGTPVLAVAAGRVIRVVEQHPRNDPEQPEGVRQANFVTIDHGDGYVSNYVHLDQQGVIVEPGQFVARGQVIAFSCDTGNTTGPHLHYEIINPSNQSIPSGFFEASRSGGVAQQGDEFASRNELSPESVNGYVQSKLPLDAFLNNGVELFDDSLPAFFYDNQQTYTVSGRVIDGTRLACVALVEPRSNETVFCNLTEVDDEGRFDMEVTFGDEFEGTYYMGMITGDGGAEGILTHQVVIHPPLEPELRPVAVIDEPETIAARFNESRELVGENSLSMQGLSLSYRWTQVGGPTVLIDDPTAPRTTFRMEPTVGEERVSFQLVVYDGLAYSLPTQVDFFMADSFYVEGIGVSNTVCETEEDCVADQTSLISLSAGTVAGWVQLLNVEPGDSAIFEIINPKGQQVRAKLLPEFEERAGRSFLRFAWSTDGLEPVEGTWVGLYQHNGRGAAQVTFEVVP